MARHINPTVKNGPLNLRDPRLHPAFGRTGDRAASWVKRELSGRAAV